jgi:hypothetical protein
MHLRCPVVGNPQGRYVSRQPRSHVGHAPGVLMVEPLPARNLDGLRLFSPIGGVLSRPAFTAFHAFIYSLCVTMTGSLARAGQYVTARAPSRVCTLMQRRFPVQADIQISGGDNIAEFAALWEWLRGERALTGLVRPVRGQLGETELGGGVRRSSSRVGVWRRRSRAS